MVIGCVVILVINMPNRHMMISSLVLGCVVIFMIQMSDKHLVPRIAWCFDVL
jgi:mannitol-specific phosphotransferase system IIBC component